MKCGWDKFIAEYRLLYTEEVKPGLGNPPPHILSPCLLRTGSHWPEKQRRGGGGWSRGAQGRQRGRDGAEHGASPVLLSPLGQPQTAVGVGRSVAEPPDKCSVLLEVERKGTSGR